MRLQARFLTVFFLLVWCPPVFVVAQQPATINLRPRLAGSEPGVPTVRVTVDRRRVPLGTVVTFTLTPSYVISDSRYVVTLFFGDGQRQVVRANEITHLYQATGTYTYSVLVKSKENKGDNRTTPPAVDLNVAPVLIDQGQPANFTAKLSRSYSNIQYRFFYGDGTSSAWQDSPYTNHTYKTAGTYRPYVDIGLAGRQLGGSTRKTVEVARRQRLTVSLTANPTSVKGRQPVLFSARAQPAGPDMKYRFAFGDSNTTLWQSSSQATHVYDRTGNYRAYVEASDSGLGPGTISAPALVGVQGYPSPRPSPEPTRSPSPSTSPAPTISPTPYNGGSPSPSPTSSSSPSATTSPSPTGSNSPNGDGTSNNGNDSGTSSSSPDPGTTSNSNSNQSDGLFANWWSDWWKYLIPLLILMALYWVLAPWFLPRPTFAAFSDVGDAAISGEAQGLPIDFQIVLNPAVSAGAYSVATDEPTFVRNAGNLEERQILEI